MKMNGSMYRDMVVSAACSLDNQKDTINNLNAVSYTHLDVYKRQVQTQAASSGSTGTQSSSSNTGTDSGGTSSQDGSSGSTGNSGTPEPTTSSVPEGAFTPEGTGTVLDSATGEDGDKQFYTCLLYTARCV